MFIWYLLEFIVDVWLLVDAIQVSLGRSAIGQADSLNLVVRKDRDLSLSSVRRWRIDIGTLDNYDINIILMILMKVKGFLTWPLTTLLFSSTSFQYPHETQVLWIVCPLHYNNVCCAFLSLFLRTLIMRLIVDNIYNFVPWCVRFLSKCLASGF